MKIFRRRCVITTILVCCIAGSGHNKHDMQLAIQLLRSLWLRENVINLVMETFHSPSTNNLKKKPGASVKFLVCLGVDVRKSHSTSKLPSALLCRKCINNIAH